MQCTCMLQKVYSLAQVGWGMVVIDVIRWRAPHTISILNARVQLVFCFLHRKSDAVFPHFSQENMGSVQASQGLEVSHGPSHGASPSPQMAKRPRIATSRPDLTQPLKIDVGHVEIKKVRDKKKFGKNLPWRPLWSSETTTQRQRVRELILFEDFSRLFFENHQHSRIPVKVTKNV